ncbi:MAG: hypothetical protein COV74_01030 [Candidatus Omnitrophica bacterium CG11_big_fil_rev_8_21_14_0_20_45_26]|uniref:Molecular chaperone Skp n=1 Tax=Candidatus Abzuiibacterium crystallinum TaxID=1974748 RepID=A0A2H0LSN9_9BACT|nr:MAG: hypothetical protein COV74_01030 [Candidatus Omnitrophica bacterium CG11_big_fil_rev_8_21_14_0_20_45_26]PIW64163.1 MAG: hypothetical protein COW12_07290 [Candidatus Omnitrophica bacterium CG12_big_fil_rev_8_21_14_0_65_45_16]
MKHTLKQMMVGSLFLSLIATAGAGHAWAAELKIAYVNIGQVFDDYEKTKKFDQELQDIGKKKQEARDAIVYEIRRLRDEQALLAQDKKADVQGKIEAKLKELEEFDQGAQQELSDKRNTIMQEILSDIDALLKQYGERKGYDFIFNERAMVYKTDKYDHTKEVLNELNNEYKKKKK